MKNANNQLFRSCGFGFRGRKGSDGLHVNGCVNANDYVKRCMSKGAGANA